MTENLRDALGVLRWEGIDAVIIPSVEGYGAIFTADPERIVITVPYEVTTGLSYGTPEGEAKRILAPMFEKVVEMLEKMRQESQEPG